jgi:hypothetical protein
MATWAQIQADIIRLNADRDYGKGWNRISAAQRKEYIESRVLMLILTQAGEQFKAAQDMARSVLEASEELI